MITNAKIEALKAQLAEVQSKSRSHDKRINEGGYGYNPHDAKADELIAEIVNAEIDAIVEDIDAIRARWNAAVAKYTVGGKLDMRHLKAIEAEAGITLTQMQSAKARMAK